MSRRTSGFSLAEVMVFCLLLGMLLSGLYVLLVGGLRMAQNGQAYQTAQQQAVIGARKLVGELSDARGDLALLKYQGPPQGQARSAASIVFLSGFPRYPAAQEHLLYDATSGQVNWQKWVGYYLVTNPETSLFDLMRAENITGLGSGVAFVVGTAEPTVPGFPPGAGWTNPRMVAKNIYELDIEAGPTANPPSLTVSLYSQDSTAAGKTDNFTQVNYRLNAWLSN